MAFETRPGMELVDAKGRLWTLSFVLDKKACLEPIPGYNDYGKPLDMHIDILQDVCRPIVVDGSGESGLHSSP